MNHPVHIPIKNKALHKIFSKLTRLDAMKEIYDDWLVEGDKTLENQGIALLDFGLQHMNIKVKWDDGEKLKNIPKTGPLMIVANHPLGGLEGMLLARELAKIRPDIKVLTNEMLLRFPEFSDIFIGVNVLSSHQAKGNASGIRLASKHLSNRGALLIFPGSTVSEIDYKQRKISDRKWNNIAARLVKKYQCPTIPFFIAEKNPAWFYLSAIIHKRLRTALLARAMISKKNTDVDIIVGDVVPIDEIKTLDSVVNVTNYLRLCCEVLATEKPQSLDESVAGETIKQDVKELQLLEQLQKLEPFRVIQKGDFSVYCAPYSKLGCMMEQIAICREKSFRAVNEGTGKELDNDDFDTFYSHLWVWDDQANKLVGGYRICKVDELINNHGIENLYSNSLYHFQPEFVTNLQGSVEVGRSFVSLEYQRHSKVLDLLWRGIGAYMVDNPEYHTLFGCVSVSKEYSGLAKALLVDALLKHFNATDKFLTSVKPKQPLSVDDKPWSDNMLDSLSNVPIINKLLGRIDSGKTIPMLIRHYLALNGRFASFTINSNFNHSLDGLIIVDLRLTPQKYLSRYLGKEGSERFLYKWDVYETVA
ncbi:MAG: hemolysin [Gammaproteobacteria bacterium]|nr:MAG: hemolysin [Gammaproteobacteria bacterium]